MRDLKQANYVAQRLGVSIHRVYELTREDRIPVVRIGERQYRYDAEAIEEFIHNGGNLKDQLFQEATDFDDKY